MLCPPLMLLSNLCAFFFAMYLFSVLGQVIQLFLLLLQFSIPELCLWKELLLSDKNCSFQQKIFFCPHFVFFFSHSSTLIVFLLQFVLLPSVQLSHPSTTNFMKSRLKSILLLKKLGIKYIYLLRSVEVTCTLDIWFLQ